MTDALGNPVVDISTEDGDAPGRQRADGRDSMFLMARLTLVEAGETHEVRVRNLSSGGLMAEITRPLAIGAVVEVDLRGIGKVPGAVAWYAEGRAGIALDLAIDPKKARKPVAARVSRAVASGPYKI